MSRIDRFPLARFVFLISAMLVDVSGTATAQSLPFVTIPVKSDGAPHWIFTADKAVSLTTTTKSGQVIGHFAA